ncbi:MAG: hypothetical protein TE42_03750 [Candidatus Synechococcus spongiarum SP3]|uniref:Uncharacterized protein n=1 Tax=Candidatus Synechococcus spongiarum SP3 TaxID=1604020 RepID=A0A0G2IWK7_9SYNE|nr:MAG: hypothetical protein TE42_03750 [Candidatus Synechococcus spongiarum SP3]
MIKPVCDPFGLLGKGGAGDGCGSLVWQRDGAVLMEERGQIGETEHPGHRAIHPINGEAALSLGHVGQPRVAQGLTHR